MAHHLTHAAGDAVLRGIVVASAAAASWTSGITVFAQAVPGAEQMPWLPYLKEGGMGAILLIVLWVYRRDYKRLCEGETERVNQLIALHEKSAKANQDVAVALSRNTEVLRMVTATVHGHNYDPREQRREDFKEGL